MSRRRKPGESALVTREQIVETAEALARRDGLDKLSVRRVSAALSVTPAALYWHIANKQQLVSEIVDRILSRVERPDPSSGTWVDQFLLYHASVREVFVEYPGISAALMTHVPTEATLLGCLYPFQLLVEGGFDEEDAVTVFRAVSTFMTGHLVMVDLARRGLGETFGPIATRLRSAVAERPEYAAFEWTTTGFDETYGRQHFLVGLDLLLRGAADKCGVRLPKSTVTAEQPA